MIIIKIEIPSFHKHRLKEIKLLIKELMDSLGIFQFKLRVYGK